MAAGRTTAERRMHRTIRFVENIFEELDAPGEWFLDAKTATLYYYPPAGPGSGTGDDRGRAAAAPRRVSRHAGETRSYVTLRGYHLPPRRADVYGEPGAVAAQRLDHLPRRRVLFEGAEDCASGGLLLRPGGRQRRLRQQLQSPRERPRLPHRRGRRQRHRFVGDPQAVRNPLSRIRPRQSAGQIDHTPGPKTDNYPADCLVEDCLIYLTGRVEKQTAGVKIAMSQGITVRHCSIYDVPRAGINIGDGCWGGHVIEFCDVFDTVQGDRRPRLLQLVGARPLSGGPDIAEVNAMGAAGRSCRAGCRRSRVILRNNRWRAISGGTSTWMTVLQLP